ncbi:diketogulonate reductase-like aldo/keto reductase [Rhizobium subbaraonis]|uniref:Diketogulonate reductase-like aldo/keto reductase n=1 Tax=Rhizobium subbaraonis TaxID=908946 RepID=A0A285U0Y9_9HYPH|nr:aldo/keto reductase [Rhizobium subbaraonis]SOC35403.1 diketogulonate reductase-like aldo/keto reductase [Rhizobium subbaraonis]
MNIIPANGANIPQLGFGTFRMPEDQVLDILPKAIDTGFRHVDTAQIYGNEAAVGAAIKASGIARDAIFLTTKVWVDNYRGDAFQASVEESLRKLQTDHVDLLLLHWPNEAVPLADQIEALNRVREKSQARHIGVSNFTTALMTEAAALSPAPLATNQVEYHPYLDQTKVIAAARALGLSITAYFAMADGKVPNDEVLQEIGARHGRTAAQAALRWLIQQPGVAALTKTATATRLKENLGIFDFSLSAEEMAAIHTLAQPGGRIVSPDGLAPRWDAA